MLVPYSPAFTGRLASHIALIDDSREIAVNWTDVLQMCMLVVRDEILEYALLRRIG